MIGKLLRSILLTVNLAVAALWLGSCYGSRIESVDLLWLELLPFISIPLLLILLAFMLLWLFVKPRNSLISPVVLAISWSPLLNIIQPRFNKAFDISKKEDAVRVFSWNVEHFRIKDHKKSPGLKDSMIDLIRKYEPDVACFQEMVASDSFPDAINYIPYFSKRLGMKYRTFSYNVRLNYDKKHHFGIITFSKYPIINRKTISFPPYNYNSIYQYSDIVKNGDTFRVFNVHLQTQKFSSKNREYAENPTLSGSEGLEESQNLVSKLGRAIKIRKEQSRRIREEMGKSPYPVILCGDFNDVPNSYAYYHIGKDMKDAFKEKGAGIDRTFSAISPTLRIDYLFCSPAFGVDQYDRIGRSLSDHYPVIADLFLEPQSSK